MRIIKHTILAAGIAILFCAQINTMHIKTKNTQEISQETKKYLKNIEKLKKFKDLSMAQDAHKAYLKRQKEKDQQRKRSVRQSTNFFQKQEKKITQATKKRIETIQKQIKKRLEGTLSFDEITKARNFEELHNAYINYLIPITQNWRELKKGVGKIFISDAQKNVVERVKELENIINKDLKPYLQKDYTPKIESAPDNTEAIDVYKNHLKQVHAPLLASLNYLNKFLFEQKFMKEAAKRIEAKIREMTAEAAGILAKKITVPDLEAMQKEDIEKAEKLLTTIENRLKKKKNFTKEQFAKIVKNMQFYTAKIIDIEKSGSERASEAQKIKKNIAAVWKQTKKRYETIKQLKENAEKLLTVDDLEAFKEMQPEIKKLVDNLKTFDMDQAVFWDKILGSSVRIFPARLILQKITNYKNDQEFPASNLKTFVDQIYKPNRLTIKQAEKLISDDKLGGISKSEAQNLLVSIKSELQAIATDVSTQMVEQAKERIDFLDQADFNIGKKMEENFKALFEFMQEAVQEGILKADDLQSLRDMWEEKYREWEETVQLAL